MVKMRGHRRVSVGVAASAVMLGVAVLVVLVVPVPAMESSLFSLKVRANKTKQNHCQNTMMGRRTPCALFDEIMMMMMYI